VLSQRAGRARDTDSARTDDNEASEKAVALLGDEANNLAGDEPADRSGITKEQDGVSAVTVSEDESAEVLVLR
jgi:hypothetical protein